MKRFYPATKMQISSLTWCLSNMGQMRDFLRKLSIAWRNGCSPVVLQHTAFDIEPAKQPLKSFNNFLQTLKCPKRDCKKQRSIFHQRKILQNVTNHFLQLQGEPPMFVTQTNHPHATCSTRGHNHHRLVQQLDPFVERDPQNLQVFVEISIDAHFKALVAQTKAHCLVLSIMTKINQKQKHHLWDFNHLFLLIHFWTNIHSTTKSLQTSVRL